MSSGNPREVGSSLSTSSGAGYGSSLTGETASGQRSRSQTEAGLARCAPHPAPSRAAELDNPTMAWFYLSFATDEDGFLGGLYIEGDSEVSAYFNATQRKLNPGGEVAIIGPLPDEFESNVPPENRNRLLTRQEVEGV